METTKMNTDLTGQTAVAASVRLPFAGVSALGMSFSGVRGGLGLDASVVCFPGAVGSDVATGSGTGTGVETGLSLGWVSVDVDFAHVLRAGRPTKAPKAARMEAEHGAYLQVIGAGAEKQDEQLIKQAKAAFMGAEAIRNRAFRGPEPWRERT
ncbi:hypothetical protein ACIGXM_07215 [Kitasatospora sp. NPDC052896]|uniref:hypothetical protein n=1 Tax=Kitasatospora sp. NPDC052896 TaxID=3364061 RepID=UPI0037C501F4